MKSLSAIEEQGFVILPEVLSPREAQALIDHIEQSGLRRSRAGVRHALKHPAVAALAWEPRLLTMARHVVGVDAFPFRATLFDKSPAANWLIVWHQDTALPLRERRETSGWGPWSVKDGMIYAHAPASALRKVLALRVHVDDCNADNGPLRVLPGTHTTRVLSDGDIEKLASRTPPVDCVVPRGGVLSMRPLLVHSSSKSQSEMPRRVLHIEYAASKIVDADLELAIT